MSIGQSPGRTEVRRQVLDARSAGAMAATLGADPACGRDGAELPPGWHWMMFDTFLAQEALAPDGLPREGGLLPSIPGLVRMRAGGRLAWQRPLVVGRSYERRSTVVGLTEKRGRSGPLVFGTVRHEILDEAGLCLTDDHEVVFRAPPSEGAAAGPPPQAPEAGPWRRTVTPGPLMLFQYSALTFNPHRIHYDQAYATGVEGYPGLLVHGPLTATLLLDLVRRSAPRRRLADFAFRAVSPLFAGSPIILSGAATAEGCRLWAAAADGRLAMEATGRFAA